MRNFTLRLNAAKNTDYIEKCFKQKLFRIKFPTKKSVDTYVYPLTEWSCVLVSIPMHWNISNKVIF